MKTKRGISLLLAFIFLLSLAGIPVQAYTEQGVEIVENLSFYREDGMPVAAIEAGTLQAGVTLKNTRNEELSVTLSVVGYQIQEGVNRLYSVKSSGTVTITPGKEAVITVPFTVTENEIEKQIAYKAMVWEGGFSGDMTPVVDFQELKLPSANLTFAVSPEYARVTLRDELGEKVYPDDGIYTLSEGKEYHYIVENIGYVSQEGTVTGGSVSEIQAFLEKVPVEEGYLVITTPEDTAINDLEPVQLNAMVWPLSADNREIRWSIAPGSEDKVELRVPDSQANGFANEVIVKPGITEGSATFIAERVSTGEKKEITLPIKEAVHTIKLKASQAKARNIYQKDSEQDAPMGNTTVGNTFVTGWSTADDYIYWSAVIPKAGIDYKARIMQYASPNPAPGAEVVLSIKEIVSTETGEDGGQQYDIIGDTVVSYTFPITDTGSWGSPYATVYSTDVKGDAGDLEQGKRYRFELHRTTNAINFDEILFMPADYDPDAVPQVETVTGVRTDNGVVEADETVSVNLSWNLYEGAKEYEIYQDNEQLMVVDGGKTTVKIQGLNQHEVYKFTVIAVMEDGTKTKEGLVVQNSSEPQPGVVFYGSQESKEHRDWRMEWFRESKYGMMITWNGSSWFGGEYTDRQVGKTEEESLPHYSKGNFPPELIASGKAPSASTYTTQGYAEWIMNYAKIPRDIYLKATKEELAAGDYDFREWVRTAKESGMRYLTVITKHHDGFAIMDTNGVGYNIVDHTDRGIDVFGELVAECRRQGMGIGAYYSQSLDWLNNGGLGGIPELGGSVYTLDAQEKYINEVVIPHLRTLAIRYNVDDIWWDMGINSTEEFRYRTIKSVQSLPGGDRMVFNGRLYDSFSGLDMEDFSTPEQNVPGKPANGDGSDWEACMTTNLNWGHAKYDNYWKTAEATLFRVINITSKGGNFLYNVGPLPDGSFPQESTDRLLEVGQWLKTNGDSIYGTAPAPFTQSVPWGRITQKTDANGNTTLYLIVTKRDLITPANGNNTKVSVDGVTYETDNRGPFYINGGGKDGAFDAMDEDMWRAAWPEDGVISLPQMYNDLEDIESVTWLDPAQETLGALEVVKDQTDGHIEVHGLPEAKIVSGAVNEENCQYTSDIVTVPGLDEQDYAAVIALELKGGPDTDKPVMPIQPDENGDVILEAEDASGLNGVSLSSGGPASHPQILGNFGTGGHSAQWKIVLPEDGTYKIKGLYQTPNNTNISYVTLTAVAEGGKTTSLEGVLTRQTDYGEGKMITGGTPDTANGVMIGANDAQITLPAGEYTIEWKRGINGNVGTWFNLCNLVLEKQ